MQQESFESRSAKAMRLAGVATWLVVVVPIASRAFSTGSTKATAAALLSVVFLAFFLFCARATPPPRSIEITIHVISSAVALVCIALMPAPFTPILLVIIAAQMAMVVRPSVAIGWIVICCAGLYFALRMNGARGALLVTSAYAMFSLFAALTSMIARREAEARVELQQANAELASMGALLASQGRLAERLRIARDLHDIMGHHLTALSLNLEAARHANDAEARKKIEVAQEIARKLLTEVRATVAEMRTNTRIDLRSVLEDLAAAFPQPRIHLEIEGLDDDDYAAEEVLRIAQEIMTNSARHGEAKNLWLTLQRRGDEIVIDAKDDGRAGEAVVAGSGLEGMRERIQARGGKIEFGAIPDGGFAVIASLPVAGAAR